MATFTDLTGATQTFSDQSLNLAAIWCDPTYWCNPEFWCAVDLQNWTDQIGALQTFTDQTE